MQRNMIDWINKYIYKKSKEGENFINKINIKEKYRWLKRCSLGTSFVMEVAMEDNVISIGVRLILFKKNIRNFLMRNSKISRNKRCSRRTPF